MSASPWLAGSLLGLAGVAVLLGALLIARFLRDRRRAFLFWGAGILLTSLTLVEEAALYLGVWSELLIQSYLVLVAVLVGLLSLGSAELSLHGFARSAWTVYVGASSALLAGAAAVYPSSTAILADGVVTGLPPTPVLALSMLVTIPAALLLIVTSFYGAVWQHRYHLLFVTAGAIVLSASGGLYVAAFPLSLYYAEFAGVLLLFLGFVRLPALSTAPGRHPAPRTA